MSTIWPLAIYSQSACRCMPCQSLRSLLRPAARVRVKASWGLSGSPWIFVHSPLFAVDDVVDSRLKWKRNVQLTGIASLPPEAAAHLRKEVESTLAKQRGLGANWEEEFQTLMAAETAEDLDGLSQFDSRMPSAKRPPWPLNTGPDLLRWNLPPQSLWSTDAARIKALQLRFPWKKTAIIELAIAKLISFLLLASYAELHDFGGLPLSIRRVGTLKRSELEKEFVDLDRLLQAHCSMSYASSYQRMATADLDRRRFLIVPEYHQDGAGDFLLIGQKLNESIKNLFDTPKASKRQSAVVAKMCSNLLSSSAPPDVQTFNILIRGFDKWNRPDLCAAAIQAFEDAKLRPNELTCAFILDHYVNSDNPDAFSKFIARMRGITNPLMLAKPQINITEAGKKRLIRTGSGKVKQKVYPTPIVFSPLLRGALKFAGLQRTLEIYHEMKSDDWGLDIRHIARLLHDCAIRGTWLDGYMLWNEFQSMECTESSNRYVLKCYACMLALCRRAGKDEAYNRIFKEALGIGCDRRMLLQSSAAIQEKAQVEAEPRSDTAESAALDTQVSESVSLALRNYTLATKGWDKDARDERLWKAWLDRELNLWKRNSTPKVEPQPLEAPPEEDARWRAWLDHELGLFKRAEQRKLFEKQKSDGGRGEG